LCAQASVSAEDIVQAISVYFQRDSLGIDEQSTNLTVARVLDSCQDLVVVDEETNELRFVHTAVRDFLEHTDGLQPPRHHAVVAELCLATVQNFASAPPTESLQARDSFHYYVVLYWVSHVAQAGHNYQTEHIQDALQDLCEERPWFRSWLPHIVPASSLVLEWNDPHKDKIMQALSSPATSFFTACAFGFTQVVDHCIKVNRNVIRKTNESGATGLHLAAEYGHLDVAEALCKADADVHSVDNDGETPLVRASANGHKTLVVFFLGAGAKQNSHGRRYGTALYGAALHGYLDVVHLLLKHGANLAAAEGRFGTALHAACVRGHVRVVKYLLDAGVDVNAAGRGGPNQVAEETASELSAGTGALRAIELLLDKKHKAEGMEDRVSPPWLQEGKLQLLLDHNVDLNILRSGFGPPLHIAARAGHVAVVDALLSHPGVQVNLVGGEYGSALQAAAMGGRTTIVQRLLEAGADVNTQAGRFGTALTGACRQGNATLADILLRAGAAVNVQAGVYGTALQAACRSGSHLLVSFLLDAGADVNLTGGAYCTSLQAAARDGYEEIVQLLIQRGASVNLKGGVFGSALEAAAVGGHRRAVEILWEAKAEAGVSLQMSCLRGHQDVVQYFLDQGCDLNEHPERSETALQAALAGQHHSLVDRLLGLGADISNTYGRLGTVLQMAAWTGRIDLVRRCLEQSVNPWRANGLLDMDALKYLGCKLPSSIKAPSAFPIVFAAAGGHSQIVQILLDAPRVSRKHKMSLRSLFPGEDNTARFEQSLGHALHAALDADHQEISSLLLRHDIRVDWPTVQCACTKSDPDFVTSLLERCLAADRKGHTVNALSAAAAHCRLELVEVLLPRVVECKEFTPGDLATALRNAVSKGHPEIVDRLLASGAQPTFESPPLGGLFAGPPRMEAVLPAAVASGRRRLVQMFLDRNTEVNVVDNTDGTALQAAAYAGAEDIVDDLLAHGADPNVEGGRFGTAVQAAAAGGHETVVKALIDRGANLLCQGGRPDEWEHFDTRSEWQDLRPEDAKNEYQRLTLKFELAAKTRPSRSQNGLHGTALQAAAVGGNVRIVAMLIEAGSDVNDIDRLGQTPLHRAAYHGHMDVAVLLVSKGAKPEAIDCCCRTPMLLAVIAGQQETFAYLFSLERKLGEPSGVDGPQKALHLAAKHGHIGIVEHLLAAQIDLEDTDTEGQTALLAAAAHGQYSMVRFLLDNGSDIHCHNNDQQTALYLAARSGHDDVVRLLLASGADSLALARQGQPALHAAVTAGHHQVVYLFAEHGSPPLDLRNRSGRTALHLAAHRQDWDMVALLLKKGADVNAKESRGKTAIAFCLAETIRELLTAYGATDPKAKAPQESGIDGPIDELQGELTESESESESESKSESKSESESERHSGRESLLQEAQNSLRWRGRPSVSSGRVLEGARRLGRNKGNRGLYRRASFINGRDVYSSDAHYGRRSVRRDLLDRTRDDRLLHSRSDDDRQGNSLLRASPYSEEKWGPEVKRNAPDDTSDTKYMITLMVECVLVILGGLMVVVVVVALAMLAMTVMIMVIIMWTMLSLLVMKWAAIFWP
jgi:ankyrin repeat protein